MEKTKWIVFEGIDGSGKTTQAKMLNHYFINNGVKSIYKHIFDSKAGNMLRDIFINNEFSNMVEVLLLCATRQAFFDEMYMEKDDYDVIILDRLFLSILSMQGKSEKEIKLINYIKEYILKDIKYIYTFYLDTHPKECKLRLINRNISDRIEDKGIEFHNNVYNRYSNLIKKENEIYIFDGAKDIISLHKEIVAKASELLSLV